MTDLRGTSRMTTSFEQQADADPRLNQMLAMYKQPATIRSMKQTYFYCGVNADITNHSPLITQYGFDLSNAAGNNPLNVESLRSRNVYYDRIGTTRRLDISNLVNELIDIRVPKDKYVVEINLVECSIEVDSKGWVSIPDRVCRIGPSLVIGGATINPTNDSPQNINIDPTYEWASAPVQLLLGAPPPSIPTNPPRSTLNSSLLQANKKTEPQTLYVRIRELDNGESYNWSVTNSGAYSIDKGHQLIVRHGDVNYSNLTLEFGHLAYVGNDDNQWDDMKNFRLFDEQSNDWNFEAQEQGQPLSSVNKFNYGRIKYLDYNQEIFNVVGQVNNPAGAGMFSTYAYNDNYQYPLTIYPRFYGGNDLLYSLGPVRSTFDQNFKILDGDPSANLERPANRPPFKFQGVAKPENATLGGLDPRNNQVYLTDAIQPNDARYVEQGYLLQGRPLFFNQQAHKISFRFMVRLISLF